MIKYVDTIKELLAFYVLLLLVSATSYSYFEGVAFVDAFWWSCVTAMTVGYGDLYPVTLGGRITSVVLMHTSVLFILPLLIGHICSKCIEDDNAFTDAEQEEIKELLKDIKRKVDSNDE